MKKTGAVWALGAMSGTSLDGIDAALLLTDGNSISEFGRSAYRAYTPAERDVLRAALGKWPDADVSAAAEVVETAHAELLSQFPEAEIVGFHGQTLAHDPHGRGTHQIGNGALLAEVLGRDVVWDFRSMDVQLGGEGAPLSPAYHFACAKWIGATAPIAFLNLGGVGNLTWIDPRADSPEAEGALLAFDTGPANAPIDDLMRARRGMDCDRNGALAETGKVKARLLDAFLRDGYFLKIPPKSLDREAFSGLRASVEPLSDADAAATLTAAAAIAVAAGVIHCPRQPQRLLVTGGGRRNPTLMAELEVRCALPVVPVEEVGLNGDMLEAQAFAYLAVRVVRGMPTSFPGTTGVAAAVGGGKISHPGEMPALLAR